MLRKIVTLSILIIVSFMFFSCSNDITDKQGNSVVKGVVSEDSSGYFYYLPKGYTGKEPMPAIYFIDPHGNGREPLEKYAALANEYGFIFIGSNSIRNGIQQSQVDSYFKQMQARVISKYSIDIKRQFTAGFSGGAKYATIIASKEKTISGVIACGGTIVFSGDYIPDFYYSGIVGTYDFNYLEVMATLNNFARNNLDFTMVEFVGGHEWPSVESFESGLTGLVIYNMKRHLIKTDNKWLKTIFDIQLAKAAEFENAGNSIDQYKTLKQTDRWLTGLINTSDIRQRISRIEQSNNFVKAVNLKKELTLLESNLRVEFIKAIENKDIEWWKNEATKLNMPFNYSDESRANIGYRLKNYISMACYMLIGNDFKTSEYDKAFKKIQIYELVDVTNPDVYLMYSKYYLLTNNAELMTVNFSKAIDNGLKNIKIYESDPNWKALFDNEDIKTIIGKNEAL